MAILTAAQRKRLSRGKFGVPGKAPASGSYPMPDRSHVANALSRVSQFGTDAEREAVRRKAYALYRMGKGGK